MDLTSLFGPDYAVLLLAIACVASLRYLRSLLDWNARSQGLPLPPGPKPLSVVGNLFGLPKIKPWLGFQDMRKEHGQ